MQVIWGGRWQDGSACSTGEEVEQGNSHMSRCGNITKYMLPESDWIPPFLVGKKMATFLMTEISLPHLHIIQIFCLLSVIYFFYKSFRSWGTYHWTCPLMEPQKNYLHGAKSCTAIHSCKYAEVKLASLLWPVKKLFFFFDHISNFREEWK